ncbi:hypothetical protein [Nocardia sp. CDC160]|uniref:hypothetical protein n=1 Tax=Nocardia sp. CDC160 TaxID=3112166 RepID=UPI002DBE127B|nr:hypothetical protein [Nocardia sp. CDC160]MEC3916805.1 hypothetical protein [Nocardia sp. CDC160]
MGIKRFTAIAVLAIATTLSAVGTASAESISTPTKQDGVPLTSDPTPPTSVDADPNLSIRECNGLIGALIGAMVMGSGSAFPGALLGAGIGYGIGWQVTNPPDPSLGCGQPQPNPAPPS